MAQQMAMPLWFEILTAPKGFQEPRSREDPKPPHATDRDHRRGAPSVLCGGIRQNVPAGLVAEHGSRRASPAEAGPELIRVLAILSLAFM